MGTTRRAVVLAAAGTAALALVGGGVALATDATGSSAAEQPAIVTSTPESADDITNIDVLRQQIRNYYGDPLGTGELSADSAYAREATGVAQEGRRYLEHRSDHRSADDGGEGTPAVVLDVDDTTLATYDYEIASNWDYVPSENAEFVTDQEFPAVPGMVDLVTGAQAAGYAVFYLTGRPATQEAATLGNLTADGVGVDAGYPAPTALPDGEDGLFTKPAVADYPDYLRTACASSPGGTCTTVQYKTATREHLEALGYDVVASFGDQESDLVGGAADAVFKLPNPSYYIP